MQDVVIAGGGPAGMVAGLLFARAGLRTTVIEKHADFLRDFRGDTVHPSTLALFDELGLLDRLLERPHQRVERLSARYGGEHVEIADFTHLPTRAKFIALMPQWEFLDFVAEVAERLPSFTLLRSTEVAGPIEDGVRVAGVRLSGGREVRARLTIAADGRTSLMRAGLPGETIGSPMDVLWFRLPKAPGATNDTAGNIDAGRIVVLIDRGDYWQCAYVVPKGAADHIRGEGIAAFRAKVAAVGPETAASVSVLADFDQVKLLTVTVDRLRRWHRPGLLVIGDAAHAMSPIGGVGINLAVQDAVAAANALAGPMVAGADPDPLLHRVATRRLLPTRLTQSMQRAIQDRVIAPLLAEDAEIGELPTALKLLEAVPMLRRLPARIVGLGFRREHIRSPASADWLTASSPSPLPD